jgi:hypothetical protein
MLQIHTQPCTHRHRVDVDTREIVHLTHGTKMAILRIMQASVLERHTAVRLPEIAAIAAVIYRAEILRIMRSSVIVDHQAVIRLPEVAVRMHRIFLTNRIGYRNLTSASRVSATSGPTIVAGPPIEYQDRPRAWALWSTAAILLLVMACCVTAVR